MRDYAERFRQTQDRMRAIEAADLQSGGRAAVGSNAPLATHLITDLFINCDQPHTLGDILLLARIKGYAGPDSRLRAGVRRLIETGFLERCGRHYVRTKGGN